MLKMPATVLVNGPITNDRISSLLDSIRSKSDSGGHSVFIGQVRADTVKGKRVKAIEYSAYEKMINKVADEIIQTIKADFDDIKSIEILHSVGIVLTGEISLFVLVSAGHRSHAIQGCGKLVEMIKEKFPVWKKEIFVDNTHEWKQGNPA